VIKQILGRDYVNARGQTSGVIPAFDYSADKDGDGYLNEAEYKARRSGMDARFEYESRLFYPAYGQMRFATNPSNAVFREWAADYTYRFLAENPLADGIFADNSFGRLAFNPEAVRESLSNYAADYGLALSTINAKIAPKWVLANTAGGGKSVEPVIAGGVSYLEEFALRPLSHNHVQFEDTAELIRKRNELAKGRGWSILDTYPQGGSPTDGRTQLAALSYYYLVADPETSMLMFNGGHEPATSWTRHWSDAVRFDVGRPVEEWSTFASGADPTNSRLVYKIYQREYDNALVLYKPLSYTRGTTGTTIDRTATTHELGGTYRVLNSNGTVGEAVTRITLRNGEGAILVKV
jgi:hypothetical protein